MTEDNLNINKRTNLDDEEESHKTIKLNEQFISKCTYKEFDNSKWIIPGSYTLALTQENKLYTWGSIDFIHDVKLQYVPELLDPPQGEIWKTIAAGSCHYLGLTQNNNIYAWGKNIDGQLGIGSYKDKKNVYTPVKLGSYPFNTPRKWNQIFAGKNSSFVIDDKHQIYSWGHCGQSIHSSSTSNKETSVYCEIEDCKCTPKLSKKFIEFSKEWKDIVIGQTRFGKSHFFAITKKNEVYAWGENEHGQLGLGDTKLRKTPELLKPYDSEIWDTIIAGDCHTIAITKNKNIYVWGNNSKGQLGLGWIEYTSKPKLFNTPENEIWKDIGSGCHHSFALTENGTLYAWGDNSNGQLGLEGDLLLRKQPHQIPPQENEKWEKIIARDNNSIGITSNGYIYVWGCNFYEQLGLGTKNPQSCAPLFCSDTSGYWIKSESLGSTANFTDTSKFNKQIVSNYKKQTNEKCISVPCRLELPCKSRLKFCCCIWHQSIIILLIGRLKEPSSRFYKDSMPKDIFKLICNLI